MLQASQPSSGYRQTTKSVMRLGKHISYGNSFRSVSPESLANYVAGMVVLERCFFSSQKSNSEQAILGCLNLRDSEAML